MVVNSSGVVMAVTVVVLVAFVTVKGVDSRVRVRSGSRRSDGAQRRRHQTGGQIGSRHGIVMWQRCLIPLLTILARFKVLVSSAQTTDQFGS